jgi:plastocyanin
VRISVMSGLFAGLVLVMATACGGGSATPAPAASVTGATPPHVASQPAASVAAPASAAGAAPVCGTGSGQAVGIANFAYSPGTLTVTAGSKVTWTNSDSTAHTVTFDAGPDCGRVASGAAVSADFSAPGSYAYHCTIHPSMRGTITVS